MTEMAAGNYGEGLERFVRAQEAVFAHVLAELGEGRKRSHWMWFIFPQIRGLGSSPMAEKFAISSLEEAKAYLEHPILGARLRQCAELVNPSRDGRQGRSSDTLTISSSDRR